MNYDETLEYLFQRLPMYQRVGKKAFKKDLNNIISLSTALGNPHEHFRSIHIAGTNGKGSVSNMLASILQEAGYKVGLYTSPHLRSFTERIRINGKMIPEELVVDFVERAKADIERIQPSFFEVTVAMAFDHFRNEKVDFAVVEVGLGGRLDSTNIITPILGAITNISLDHQNFLGETLPEIAGEKAGIFKKDTTFVIGQDHFMTRDVFEKHAEEKGARIVFAERSYKAESMSLGIGLQALNVIYNDRNLSTYKIGLGGEFQRENAVTVLAMVRELGNLGVMVGEHATSAGFRNVKKNTGFRGRMSILGSNPPILTDVGHNEAGVREVLKAIGKIPHVKLHMVWGMVKDKDIKRILYLLPRAASYYFVCPDVPRGLDVEELKERANKLGLHGDAHSSVQAGLDAAKAKADPKDLIFVGGSTFVVAEVI